MKTRKMLWGIIAYGIVGVLGLASTALAKKPSATCGNNIAEPGEGCDGTDLRGATCESEGFTGGMLACTPTCQVDESGCFSAPCAVFPGDGAGSGPPLSYTDNIDGTVTDDNTLLMWEKKLAAGGSDGGNCQDASQANRSVHCVNNTYTWSSSGAAADGTLFTVFLATLNNTCDGDETTACTSNAACTGNGNGLCGHAGHSDWRIPNVKELQSIVDYGQVSPAIDPTFPGPTAASLYWSSTSFANNLGNAWGVNFNGGNVPFVNKAITFLVRAVRGGS